VRPVHLHQFLCCCCCFCRFVVIIAIIVILVILVVVVVVVVAATAATATTAAVAADAVVFTVFTVFTVFVVYAVFAVFSVFYCHCGCHSSCCSRFGCFCFVSIVVHIHPSWSHHKLWLEQVIELIRKQTVLNTCKLKLPK
jgi:hypothetical protein